MAIPSQSSSAKSKAAQRRSVKSRTKSRASSSSLKLTRPPLLVASKTSTRTTTTTRTTRTGSLSSSLSASSLSSRHTRALINTHHLLQKRLARARSRGDATEIREIEAQLAAQGGLKAYQLASRTGQSAERGGDSSRVLVRWLDEELRARKAALAVVRSGCPEPRQREWRAPHNDDDDDADRDDAEQDRSTKPTGLKPLRILEIGALSTRNALNVAGVTRVRRIDLRSADEGIEEMDFMHLPLPLPRDAEGKGGWDDERGYYDVLSLSLVLNYVPDPKARGAMLKRTTLFFAPQPQPDGTKDRRTKDDDRQHQRDGDADADALLQLPCLFLVLPSPCLHNSRYLTPQHLTAILNSLGYTHLHTKTTRKLHYSLWRFDGPRARGEWIKGGGDVVFKKREINPGGGRNNFCIVLDDNHPGS
ncbi:uncharacterized protein Z519_02610 [Cladophialophora bantiana CBS 173.52]|uniref:25S rRNA adenine-N(1) methyltransferase n=1 Tax=Cladophialophora bantiana (strain ATCC 10958 / CBS 173.52 / CDC B-1940 / NIH 8579) TaxID=1442370 RepID=A0A0D2HV24_CLAB1|nr:uncharacterized protein Z519_02610 [Cladophialophora bantiana CBS 173.52]KIW97218.1 hypothetical protein Z519_02610 [Cladophialophora bantiana CBS 173.52]